VRIGRWGQLICVTRLPSVLGAVNCPSTVGYTNKSETGSDPRKAMRRINICSKTNGVRGDRKKQHNGLSVQRRGHRRRYFVLRRPRWGGGGVTQGYYTSLARKERFWVNNEDVGELVP